MATGTAPSPITPRQYCTECGRAFAPEDLVRFAAVAVCGDCKPTYAQRMREGAITVGLPGDKPVYAGFWIRVAAMLLDSLIFGFVFGIIFVAVISLVVANGKLNFDMRSGTLPSEFWLIYGLSYGLFFVSYAIVNAYFVSQKGGTPGKLITGLRVVTVSGQRCSFGRAIGRFFAHMLSGFILYIGYIIAAFDDEKRALHDHICGTRVIHV